jgi:amidase
MAPLFQALVSGLALVGSVVASKLASKVDTLVESQVLTDPYAYDFPRLGAEGASLFAMRKCHGFTLEEASVDQIQAQLKNGTFTTVQLLECYMDRVYQTQPYLK